MILGPIGGNSGFDGPFLIIQLAVLTCICLGFIFSSYLPRTSMRASMRAVVGLTIIGELLVPLFWYLAYPSVNGIEEAGRLFFLIPFFLLNTVCSIILILKLRKRRSKVAIP